jgi:transketolase
MLKYAVDFVEQNNISASIFSFPFIKPINNEALADIFNTYKKIITIEEHQAQCGFGSAILEILNNLEEDKLISTRPLIKRLAIPDKFYSVAGSQDYLRSLAGLELRIDYFI